MVQETRKWKEGDRISVSGNHGTIRYIGRVEGTSGEWLGIDWDDCSRGKHNGSHEGITYFQTRHPTSGSFVRSAKVTPSTSCVEAIKAKYGLIEENAGVDLESIAAVQKDIRAKFIQFVGAEKINKKQSQFKSLQVVSLRDELISDGGTQGELGLLCPNIQELDLSKNLLSNWRSVVDIALQLPLLRVLNLSENKLEIPDCEESGAFNHLEHLILARNELRWEDAMTCCRSMPHLKELQLPFNLVTEITPTNGVLVNIQTLDLEGNHLADWQQVNKLGALQHLRSLNVTACSLKDIRFPEKSKKTALFPALEHLVISDNDIVDWISISELDKLASLKDLRVVKNPFLEKEDSPTNNQLIIARIGMLQIVNGLTILPEERRGAELDFLKRHGREYLKIVSEEDRRRFHLLYPCYERIVTTFGPPEENEIAKGPVSLKNSLITIHLFSPSENRLVKKKVPGNMTVQKLCGLVERLFDTGSHKPRFFHQHSVSEFELDNEMKDLNYFSIEDGSKIEVRW